MTEFIFTQSHLIDADEVSRYCFTSLPVRRHARDDIANAATLALVRDWGELIQDGREKTSHCSLCEKGNWCSFIFPESLPERLGLLTYLTDVGLIHDDACEEMSVEEATREHLDLEAALDLEDRRVLAEDSKSIKTKNLVSQALLECIKLDHKQSIGMLEAYREKWLSVMEHPNTDNIQTLDEFFLHRPLNGGMGAYWAMISFSLAVTLTPEDEALIKDIVDSAERALLLTNDYYSWERELEQLAIQDEGKIFNSVWFIMKQDGVSADRALQKVKEMILRLETEFIDRKEHLYANNKSLPHHIMEWVESAGLAVAGNHYWSAICPRHNDWKVAPRQAPPNHVSVSDLAAMSRMEYVDLELAAECEGNGLSNHEPMKSQAKKAKDMGYIGSDHKEKRLSKHVNSNGKRNNLATSEVNKNKLSLKKVKLHGERIHQNVESRKINGNGCIQEIPHVNGDFKSKGNSGQTEKLDLSAVLAPCNYIRGMPSKGFRSSLIEALNNWMRVPPKRLEIITNIIDMLHSSSLILDDVEDNSSLRRGKPSAHVIFGSSQAINSATFLYVRAVQVALKLRNNEATTSVIEELERLFVGQSWDLYWKFNLRAPTEEEYFQMIDQKTGGLFRMLMRLMLASSPIRDWSVFDFDVLAQKVGRFFQIRDDYMNLASQIYSQQKGFCEDLDEGKFSYLIVHCLQHSVQCRDHILGVFRQHAMTKDQPLSRECKMHILECLEETRTMDATAKLLEGLEVEIESAIKTLEMIIGEPNHMLLLLLKTLSIREGSSL